MVRTCRGDLDLDRDFEVDGSKFRLALVVHTCWGDLDLDRDFGEQDGNFDFDVVRPVGDREDCLPGVTPGGYVGDLLVGLGLEEDELELLEEEDDEELLLLSGRRLTACILWIVELLNLGNSTNFIPYNTY